MSEMFRSLAVRNYRIWLIGALISNIGAWMQATTQSWVVLTELTAGDATAVGITMALQFGPPLALVAVAGWVTDRFDRRLAVGVTQGLLALLSLGLGLLLLGGHAQLWQLYMFALGFGIINAFDAPLRQAILSELVAGEHTSNAIALNAATFNVARLIGPAVAGVMIAIIGSGWVFIFNASTFLAVLVSLLMIRVGEMIRRHRSKGRVSMSAGFRYVGTRGDLIVVFIIVFLMGAFGMNFPIFASTMALEFGKGSGEYGLMSSIIAIGALAGALGSARRERARLRVIFAAAAFFGVATTALALSPDFVTFAVLGALDGFAIVTLLTTANGYTQSTSDPVVRGRVIAIYMAILMGGSPIGAPIVGWVAATFGPRWAIAVAAFAGFLAFAIGVIWLYTRHGVRLRRHDSSRWRLQVTTPSNRESLSGDLKLSGGYVPVPTTTSPISVVTENFDERR